MSACSAAETSELSGCGLEKVAISVNKLRKRLCVKRERGQSGCIPDHLRR